METQDKEQIRTAVRQRYGETAKETGAGCGCAPSAGCCGSQGVATAADISLSLGYSPGDLLAVPEAANLGLGCGNPQAIASLRPGESVLDLGSGGGLDCFLAAQAVGDQGRVIGVDMTPEMVSRARNNAAQAGLSNVEIRLGEIENLPVADGTIDVILSNCVINLSPDKDRVFQEAYRVLKPGGRLAISDMLRTADMPPAAQLDMSWYTACVAGACSIDELRAMLERAGFESVRIRLAEDNKPRLEEWITGASVEDYTASASIEAIKPLA